MIIDLSYFKIVSDKINDLLVSFSAKIIFNMKIKFLVSCVGKMERMLTDSM